MWQLIRSAVYNFYRSSKNYKTLSKFLSTSNPKEETVKIGKWNINYLKVGSGPHNVLCIPGALGSIWTDYKPQIEGFNKDIFTLVVWDPPGYGKSRPPEKEFSADFYEKDANVAFDFMKCLNIAKYSVLGWSDGGIVALILSAKHPEVVNKLVIWGANSFLLPTELESILKIQDVNTWSPKMKDPMIAVYGEELFAKYWKSWTEGMKTVFNSRNGNICTDILKDILCPTLILHGEKDPLVDNVHVSHLHTHIAASRIHLYPDGKHNIHLRFYEDFNKRVQEFLLQKY